MQSDGDLSDGDCTVNGMRLYVVSLNRADLFQLIPDSESPRPVLARQILLNRTVCMQQQRSLAGGTALQAWHVIVCVRLCNRCGRYHWCKALTLNVL